MADIKLNEDPASTWGATEAYKAAWFKEYGVKAPAASASKADWVDFAVEHGATRDEAEAQTRDQLAETYGEVAAAAAPVAVTGDGGTTYGNVEAGAGVDSGTPAGTPATSTSPATGTKGR